MNKSKFLLAITSAVVGAGIMLVANQLTAPPAIEGWIPVNTAVASALAEGQQSTQSNIQEQSDNKDKLTPSSKMQQNQNQASGKAGESTTSANTTTKVNINTANLVELQNIPGVGEKKAQTIIDYRNKHGAFKKVQDLTKVKGIGAKSFQKMKPFIEIGS